MKKLIYAATLLLVVVACKKDEPLVCPPEPFEVPNYAPTTQGSYWVYRYFREDDNGDLVAMGNWDSVVIVGDTIIELYPYTIKAHYGLASNAAYHLYDSYFRTFSGYIINEHGDILYDPLNRSFTDTIAQHHDEHNNVLLYSVYSKMQLVSEPVTVPAGEFDVIGMQTTVVSYQQLGGVDSLRHSFTYYAEDIGQIEWQYYYSGSNQKFFRKLERYHIEE